MSKKFFNAIKGGDLETVKAMLKKQPELISATAKAPPKKDDGQSTLQIAIRNQQFKIANCLLDCGADVNFMEPENCCNEWRMPVLQDAITCAVMLTRWNVVDADGSIEFFHSSEEADAAYTLLNRMLNMGADICRKDSYGNSCLERAILDASQILPRFDYSTKEVCNDRVITDELKADLNRIFQLLFDHGASCMECNRYTNMPLIEHHKDEPVAEFLRIGIK